MRAGDKFQIRFRPAAHVPSNEDPLACAGHVFLHRALRPEFGKLAYPKETNGFHWDASQ